MLDTHTHSHHSPDAQASMAAMAEAAVAAGLAGLAFTDHVEWEPGDEATGYLQPAAYFAELEAIRVRDAGRLAVLAGAEFGSPHRFPTEAAALAAAYPWDFILGSLHWVDGEAGWLRGFFDLGLEAAYERYFYELTFLARTGEYDILSHLDIIRRDSQVLYQQVLPLEPFAELIRATLQAVVERGKGLEINTSAVSMGAAEPLPNLTVLRWYRELGGELLVFGSDAHTPERVGRHFALARELALAAGFTHLARFERRQVVDWIPL